MTTSAGSVPRVAVRKRAILSATAIVVVLVVALVARTIWVYRQYPFDADEAIHANGGLALALDLRSGDLGGFFRTLYGQGFYPPAFNPLKAAAFLVFGASPLVARLFTLACLPASLLMIYLTSRLLDEERGWLIGAIAVVLTVTSQFVLIVSALVMMEVPGLLASFGLLWLYLKALKKPSAARLVGTGLMLGVTFLTKYTYGLAAVASVLIMEASRLLIGESRRQGEGTATPVRDVARRWLWLLGPFVLVVVVWFARPYKIAEFWSYATAQPSHRSWSLQTVLFYPRSIALHYTPSPPFALVTLVSLAWSASQWRRPSYRLLLIYFLVGMGEMTLNSPKSPRFILTFVPAAHALTGAMIAQWLKRWRGESWRGWGRVASAVLVVSLVVTVPVLLERFRSYSSVMEVAYETHPKLKDLAAWIADRVAPGEPFYVVNFWDQMSPWALSWHLGTRSLPARTRFADISLPSVLLDEPSPRNVASLREEIRSSEVSYLVAFEGSPWGAPAWWIYAGEMSDMLDPIDRRTIEVDLYDTGSWLRRSLLTKRRWERVKAEGRYTLQVTTTVYAVDPP